MRRVSMRGHMARCVSSETTKPSQLLGLPLRPATQPVSRPTLRVAWLLRLYSLSGSTTRICVFHRGQNHLNAVAYLGNSTISAAAHERTVAGVPTPSDGRFLKYGRCQSLSSRCL